MKLDRKVAVVTGAARGIGQTIALTYVCKGAPPSLWDIDADGLNQTKRTKGEALALKTDVTRPDEIESAVKATRERFGQIDILVNSAALKMAFYCPT